MPASKVVHSGVVGHEGRAPGSCRVDDDETRHLTGPVRTLEGDGEPARRIQHFGDGGGSYYLQAVVLLVPGVVVGDDILGRCGLIGGIEADPELVHPGQIVNPVRVTQTQCLPPELPGATGPRATVQHHELVARVEAKSTKVVPDREACLPGSDHDNRGVDVGVCHPPRLPGPVAVAEGRQRAAC